MRYNYRFIILLSLLITNSASAHQFFIDAIEWRPTESNNWAYVNSLTVPNQTINYKTIDFNYSPGFRVGAVYASTWDALLSYTHYYTTTHDSATGAIQPSFVGSVTAKPSTAYLYSSGQVSQSINYNIFDLNVGKQFYPAEAWMLHPFVGLMGGWINQTIHANYQGSTSTAEKITNNFIGMGPKIGSDTGITLVDYKGYQPKLVAAFAASYLVGNWVIKDEMNATPARTINVTGSSQSFGALTLQGSLGLALEYNKFTAKLAYEINDWLNQSQFFDNDTGTHNNDLVLQGLTLGITYQYD
jgi:hypothetical protein